MNYMRPRDPPPSPPSWPSPEVEPAPFQWVPRLLSFLRRRWLTMAAGVVAAVALGLAYALTATPKFTSEADLLFDVRRADMLRQQGSTPDAVTLNSVLESQVELLQSLGLARKTAARLELDGARPFAPARRSPLEWLQAFLVSLRQAPAGPAGPDEKIDMAARQLMAMTKVRRIGQTYVIAISVISPSAEEAAWLANGVAETYLADELQAKEDGIQQATGWLQVRIKELHDQALTADRAVQDYKARHNIVDTERGLMGGQQLTELSTQLTTARATAAAMQARYERIEAIMKDGVDGGGVTDGLDNRVIVALRQQYVDDERRMTDLSAKFGRDHAVVRDLRNEMAEIKKSIQGELARIAESYKSDREVARANEASVQARLDRMVAQTEQTNNDLVLLRSLQSSADTYRSLYQNFLQRYTQAVQDESFPVAEARMITAARPAPRKSEPRTTMIAVLAAALGLSGGFAAAFLRESLDRGIRDPARLRAVTGLDCLGLVPRLRRRYAGRVRRLRPSRHARAPAALGGMPLGGRVFVPPQGGILSHAADAPRSAFADAIRALRTRIIRQHLRAREIRIIGCVSSARGAGASTIAANLALLLARTSGRTILLDWDFLNASLSLTMTGAPGPGCLDILAGRAGLAEVVRHDPEMALSFLPAGSFDDAAFGAALMHSEQMHQLLADLRAEYSYVVVDLPSLPLVADAHVAAHLLDAIVVVTQWGLAEREPLAEKLARIGLDETNVLGVLLNKADLKASWEAPAVGGMAVVGAG